MDIKIVKFGSGPVNVNRSFLNTIMEVELIFISRLFHSVITAGKKESFKKLSLFSY